MTGAEQDEVELRMARMRGTSERILRLTDGDVEEAITVGIGTLMILAHGREPYEETMGAVIASLRDDLRYRHAMRRQAGGS